MKRTLLLILIAIITVSCGKPEQKFLTPEQIEQEKQAIIKVVKAYNKASEDKNFAAMLETLANEVNFFNTDSHEVVKTIAEFKDAMSAQWEKYDIIDYGELADISIQMDDKASLASIIFGVPCDLTIQGVTNHFYLRGARTLRKEKNRWVIVSGILSVVSVRAETAHLE